VLERCGHLDRRGETPNVGELCIDATSAAGGVSL
jgi:hypothetical protein